MRAFAFFLLSCLFPMYASADEFVVHTIDAADLKPVPAEIDSAHRAVARARIGGTITEINVTEGADVTRGDVIAVVSDPKQPLEVESLDAKLKGAESERAQAEIDVKRYTTLRKNGIISQSKMDELNTRLSSLTNNVKAIRAERDAAIAHQGEGDVLAPMSGRVLTLPVPKGNVVMAGETVAELTAGALVLKISVPERNAGYLALGTQIKVMKSDADGRKVVKVGTVAKVYPEVQDGRVTADVTLPDLSNIFIGERMTAYVPTAKRKAIYIPLSMITTKHGLHYVKLKSGGETVVEIGLEDENGVEVLSGLRDGDVLVSP